MSLHAFEMKTSRVKNMDRTSQREFMLWTEERGIYLDSQQWRVPSLIPKSPPKMVRRLEESRR